MINEQSDFLEIKDNFAKTAHIPSICKRERTTHQDALVTMAIPTYNDIDGLKCALNSVVNQEEYDDYNIMIVNNSHWPNEIIDEIVCDSRISYYENKENIGMCGNWNRVIELSQAKWTVMLHDDDYIMPNYLKEVMKIIDARPNAGIVQTARTGYRIPNIESAKLPFERFGLLDIFPGGQLHAPSGMLMRTEYIKNLGGWNDDHTNLFDYWFSALFLAHYPVYVTPLKLTNYRFSLSRYPHDVRVTLIVGEYWLFLKVMQYCGIPKRIANIRSSMLVVSLCKNFDVPSSDLPFAVSSYNHFIDTWTRRYFKYVRILVHKWVNNKDKMLKE